MRDLFVVASEHDVEAARDTAARLDTRGLDVGETVWIGCRPEARVLPAIDRGLVAARYALVLVTRALIAHSSDPKELDGLAARRRVICVLHGTDEAEVAQISPRLATSALPQSLVDRLERLVRRTG